MAEVIGVTGIPALGPGGGHGITARSAADDATQWKLLARVLAYAAFGATVQSLLNAPIGLEADQRLVPPLGEAYPPFRGVDVPGIDRPLQDVLHALEMHLFAASHGELREAVEVALDLDLAGEAPTSKTFQNVADD
ncbi:hypothetical protein [Methyloligella halotolerans]|uniref:hypothetical protein n=1 Tax=Methyloligella halotolerans TaxID=1177755 RepID=UPI00083D7631|nr:hypothetical protein [Methyloligella halotolerans]